MLAAAQNDSIAGPVLIFSFLMASVIYMVGYRHARWHSARNAYINTKKAVKPLRAAKWAMWRNLVGVSVVTVIGFLLLVAYGYSQGRTR